MYIYGVCDNLMYIVVLGPKVYIVSSYVLLSFINLIKIKIIL